MIEERRTEAASPARDRSDYGEIVELLGDYYDGLYDIDIAKLRRVFSPTARYATIANGSPLELSIDDYFVRLAKRTPPAKEGTPRICEVVSIRIAGRHTALAEVTASLFGHDYTDLLSLLRIDGEWRIQAKVFEGVAQPTKEAS